MVGVNDLCTRNCVAVQPSHFRMPLRFASRLSSTDLIYALLRRNINIYAPCPLSLRRRGDGIGENIEKRREEIEREIERDISWIQEEKFRFSRLPRLVQLCALPSPLSNK